MPRVDKRTSVVVTSCAAGIGLFFWLLGFIRLYEAFGLGPYPPVAFPLLLPSALLGSACILIGALYFFYFRYLARLQAFREAVMQDVDSVAVDQPTRNLMAFPLPHTIRLRIAWGRLVLLALTIIAGSVVTGSIGMAVAGNSMSMILHNISAWMFLGALFWLWLSMFVPHRLEVTNETITSWAPARRTTLSWDNIRIFAITGKGYRGSKSRQYNLEDSTTIIRWHDYEMKRVAEIDALLSLVAAKTGLPLLDTRRRPRSQGT
jgi:hypothetical protein